ncbi:hypothetical protein [Bacillus toyonensis]|uniref:hypothetical protein n=1 Tax=Bacillus toyonensis TaxID=155322 RepID=UPI0015D4A107|nr:hypothetical protein [Bacillus toyonensis]
MKKVIALVTTLALAGALYISPANKEKEQPKQVAKDAQTQIMLRMDPGTGMG